MANRTKETKHVYSRGWTEDERRAAKATAAQAGKSLSQWAHDELMKVVHKAAKSMRTRRSS